MSTYSYVNLPPYKCPINPTVNTPVVVHVGVANIRPDCYGGIIIVTKNKFAGCVGVCDIGILPTLRSILPLSPPN